MNQSLKRIKLQKCPNWYTSLSQGHNMPTDKKVTTSCSQSPKVRIFDITLSK